MSSTTALVPYPFEGHSIRVSTDQRGEAWFVAADVCTALAQHPIARVLATLKEEEHCLHSQEGPGSEGCTLALINGAGLLRILLMGDSPTAWRMRRWFTQELLPAIQRSHQHPAPKNASPIEAIRKQLAAEVLGEAEAIIHLTGVSYAEALLSALEGIQINSAPAPEPEGACCLQTRTQPSTGENQRQSSKPRIQHLPPGRPGMAWLTADQVADRLDRTLRETNQRLAACCLQLRNDEDDWQLTEAGRHWGLALPRCSRGERRQQIFWDPALLTLLQEAIR